MLQLYWLYRTENKFSDTVHVAGGKLIRLPVDYPVKEGASDAVYVPDN